MDVFVATNFALKVMSILFLLLAILTVYKGVVVVPQRQVYLIERFGKYQRTLTAGLNLIIPFLDKVADKVDILERQLDPQSISVLTKDNVEIKLVTIIFLRIIDASKAIYRIRDMHSAVENAATSIVRSAGGELQLDEIQISREKINQKVREDLSKAAEIWGIEINRTEIIDVVVDDPTRKAQRIQLDADREKRAAIATSEGKKRSKELVADAELYAAQKKAEGIRAIAEAEAYQTEVISQAILNKGQPAINFEILKRQIDGLSQIASSGNTKTLIIPTEITGILGSLKTILQGINASEEKSE